MTEVRFDEAGLIAVVAQHHVSGEVLMVAFANDEAVTLTRDTGWLHLYSRSRRSLWQKGESSGNRMKVHEMLLDCDRDALVVKVEPEGPACHTGERSCFFHPLEAPGATASMGTGAEASSGPEILAKLFEVLKDRRKHPVEKSYTTYLFAEGVDKILKKVGEEATEVVIAAKNGEKASVVSESADLIYHLMVLFVEQGIDLALIYRELEKRAGAPRREKGKK